MASITCRNGETFPNTHKHDSVAAVRQCQGVPSSWKPAMNPEVPTKDARNTYLNPKGVPAKLAAFDGSKLGVTGAEAMANAKQLTDQLGEFISQSVDPMPETTAKLASQFNARRVPPELEASVPDGRYAITGPDGDTKFYRVRKVTKGQYAGRTFVDRQASDEAFPVRYATERTTILRAIAKDVKAAAIRYGKELGQCSQCGRTLTNPESIAAGIGPVCLSRLG
jgi:hypothetical protein